MAVLEVVASVAVEVSEVVASVAVAVVFVVVEGLEDHLALLEELELVDLSPVLHVAGTTTDTVVMAGMVGMAGVVGTGHGGCGDHFTGFGVLGIGHGTIHQFT